MDQSLSSDDLVDMGEAHHKAGQLPEAEACYRKALEIDASHPGALYFLANIAYDDGRLQFAQELTQELLRDEPNDAEAWHLLGMIALKESNFSAALSHLENAIRLQPDYALAFFGKGSVLHQQGELDAALACYERATTLNTENGEAFFGLANVLQNLNQLDRAIANYRKAISLNYVSAPIYVHLGNALSLNDQRAEAKEALEKAIYIDPNCTDAYHNLGNLLIEVGQVGQGIEVLNKAIALNPNKASLRTNLALALFCTGKLQEAIACLNEAIDKIPGDAEARSILLGLKQYTPGYSREALFADHVKFGDVFEAPLRSNWYRQSGPVNPQKRLRIGFVSADLYRHPVGHFLESTLRELRRKDQVDIVVYAMNSTVDSLTERLQATAHTWLSVITLPDEALDRRIREDKIDILIDLSGHTVPNRLQVFSRKPAPIQVSWLGYWETTGLQAMDYILCDPVSVHEGEEKYFIETPWRLPHTRLCFTLPEEEVEVSPLPALHKNRITFGCFNNPVKMTDAVVSLWVRILKRVPDSHLFLKSISFADSVVRDSVIARFAAQGIASERLDLEINSPRNEYFAAYGKVDIALDPFPFPGGTTSIEGLWMGVPMITLQGDRIISRQGESILHNLGMQDWIALNEDDYVDRAVAKAADLEALSALRGGLRNKLVESPLCNSELFSSHLYDAFKKMWEQYCRS